MLHQFYLGLQKWKKKNKNSIQTRNIVPASTGKMLKRTSSIHTEQAMKLIWRQKVITNWSVAKPTPLASHSSNICTPKHFENRKFRINMNDFTRFAYILIPFFLRFLSENNSIWIPNISGSQGWFYITATTIEKGKEVYMCFSYLQWSWSHTEEWNHMGQGVPLLDSK